MTQSQSSVFALIENILNQHDLVLFMKGTKAQPRCGFSAAVVDILQRLGAPFYDVDVLQNPLLREGIKQYGNWPTLPQLYHKGQLVGGCDIIRELDARGELAATLGLSAASGSVPTTAVQQMTVQQLKQKLDAKEPLRLYDVRSTGERQIAIIPGAIHFTEEARTAMELLPKNTPLVFHCHHGGRSQAAAETYVRKGFRHVWNVQGGIDAWSLEIDPSVQRY